MFHSDLLLRRRISFSPPQPQPQPSLPPATFREALLRPETTDFETHEVDLHAGGNPAGNQQHTRRHARPSSSSLPSTRLRECACGRVAPFPVTRLHTQGRPAPSCCSIPPAVHPEPSLSTFWPILPPPPSVSRLLYGLGHFFLHLQFHSRDFNLHNRDLPSY